MCAVTWFYRSPLISPIRKPQPNYPFCLLSLIFCLSLHLCDHLQGNYCSPSVSWCSFWCSYCWAKVSLSPGGRFVCVYMYYLTTLQCCARVCLFIQACHILCVFLCWECHSLSALTVTMMTWWCRVTGVKKSVRMLRLIMWASAWCVWRDVMDKWCYGVNFLMLKHYRWLAEPADRFFVCSLVSGKS